MTNYPNFYPNSDSYDQIQKDYMAHFYDISINGANLLTLINYPNYYPNSDSYDLMQK